MTSVIAVVQRMRAAGDAGGAALVAPGADPVAASAAWSPATLMPRMQLP